MNAHKEAEARGLEKVRILKRWSLSGFFQQPNAILLDPKSKRLLVSNRNDAGGGYISSVSLKGEMIEKRWSKTKLVNPRGMLRVKDEVYVADDRNLVILNAKSGVHIRKYTLDAIGILNSVAEGNDGHIYVSDRTAPHIYRTRNNRLEIWLENRIASASGMFIHDDWMTLLGSDYGDPIPEGHRYYMRFSLKRRQKEKQLFEADIQGELRTIRVADEQSFFLSDEERGILYYLRDGKLYKVLETSTGLAEFEFDTKTQILYIPIISENKIYAFNVIKYFPKPKKKKKK